MTLRFCSLICLALLIGCQNGSTDSGLHGNSTRHASVNEAPAEQANYTEFGEKMKLSDEQAIPVATVVKDPSTYEGKYVRMVGNVDQVCTRKGCWMEMRDTNTQQAMFVKFTCPIEGRLIPMEAVGKPTVVEGYVKVTEISEADARHIKEEAGASDEEVARVKGPQKQITLDAPAARVLGL